MRSLRRGLTLTEVPIEISYSRVVQGMQVTHPVTKSKFRDIMSELNVRKPYYRLMVLDDTNLKNLMMDQKSWYMLLSRSVVPSVM